MPSNTSGAVSGATVHGFGAGPSLVDKRIMLLVLGLVMCGVWSYARFGGPAPPIATQRAVPVTGNFAEPIAFIATPGLDAAHIHVRSGPGAGFKIRETLNRGEPLSGIARTTDAAGAFWIELANGRGYVKESVLTPASGQTPP
jgi:hypothetical protein